ncbi:hypothetical protein EAT49_08595 [Histidinibacterium lentulum]|uniref:Uncharacterized protein n=1 Tax=Histidinibacterium lentulum TaxID=2480588 RepID=A0A3N2R4H7_9RHOB|nr:hypothetical protein EAT49_08595 [Histidinibacterium lentulum]
MVLLLDLHRAAQGDRQLRRLRRQFRRLLPAILRRLVDKIGENIRQRMQRHLGLAHVACIVLPGSVRIRVICLSHAIQANASWFIR